MCKVALESYLSNALSSGLWSTPPKLNFINTYGLNFRVFLQISIDSGKGATKFMVKFSHTRSGQHASDIFLLAEAHSIRQTFQSLHSTLQSFSPEIEDIMGNGISVNNNCICVAFLFVEDLRFMTAFLE